MFIRESSIFVSSLFIARLIEAMMAQSLCIFIEEWISLFHHHRFHSNISLYYLQRDMYTAERDSYITCIFIVSCCCWCCFLPHRSHYIHIGTTPLQMRTATCDELFSAASDRLVIIKEKKIFQTVKQKIGQNATWKREKYKEKQEQKIKKKTARWDDDMNSARGYSHRRANIT